MARALKSLIAFLLLPAVMAFVVVAVRVMRTEVPLAELQWMLLGLGGYILLYPLLSSKNLTFIELYEHETNHMVTNMAILRTIDLLRVDEKGGVVESSGKVKLGCFTTLAPYFLSLFTLPLVLARIFVPEVLYPYLDVAIGISLGFHFVGLAKEFRYEQPDLKSQTFMFSFIVTVLANTILLMAIVVLLTQSIDIFVLFLQDSMLLTGEYYSVLLEWLADFNMLSM